MSLTAGGLPAPSAATPATDPRPGRLARLRRAGLVGCAALLVGTTALTTAGMSAPSPVKVPGGAFVTADLTLEAEPVEALAPAEAFGLGGGVTLVAESVATLKAHTDPFSDSPLCASYPVAPGTYRMTSPYGYRTHPIFGSYTMHMGVDFAAPLGTPIHAVTDGTVVYTGAGRLGRSSELVIIEHTVKDTTFYSWYVHMYPDGVFVEPGQHVRAGEVIAEVGSNGNSTGPHLHFEIHTSDAGLGLTKTPVRRTSTAMVLSAAPSPSTDPTEDGTDDPDATPDPDDPNATPDPEDPNATPDPDDPNATPDPDDPNATPDPDDPNATPDPEDPNATPDPDDPNATPDPEDPNATPDPDDPNATPSPEPSETPSPDPSETPSPDPSETPSPEPSETPSPEPTEEPSDEPSTEEPTEESRPRNPFPTRAYGTTVDPLPFLASLGLTLVAPSQCTAP